MFNEANICIGLGGFIIALIVFCFCVRVNKIRCCSVWYVAMFFLVVSLEEL